MKHAGYLAILLLGLPAGPLFAQAPKGGPATDAIKGLQKRLFFVFDRKVNGEAAKEAQRVFKDVRSTVERLTALLTDDKDAEVRLHAAKALVEAGPAAYHAVPQLGKALADPNEGVRFYSALALSQMGPLAKGAVPALVAALKDKSPFVRRRVAVALGDIGPGAKAAVPALKQALNDPDRGSPREVSVSDAAGLALKRIEGKE